MKNTVKKFLISTIAGLAISANVIAEVAPKVINFGVATAGVGGRPAAGGSGIGTVHSRQALEQAFKEQGTEIKWTFFPTAGPGVNESLSNNLLDVVWEGDLAAVVGHAAGLDTRIILSDSRNGIMTVIARSGSGIKSVADLRGKKVAMFKGTCLQLSAARILAEAGLTEKDIRSYNMDPASANAALASGDIDALFTSATGALPLRDRGLGEIIYDGRKDGGQYGCTLNILATSKFAKQYPETLQKLVTTLVKERIWSTDPNNFSEVTRHWAKSGYAARYYREEYEGANLRHRFSPLLDDYLRDRFKLDIEDSYKLRLIRKKFDVDSWFDDQYIKRAFIELGITEDYWK